jgi:hypothetical protein
MEQLAVDEVIVLYKGRIVFRQYIPKKQDLASKFTNFATLGYIYESVFRETKATCHSSNSNAWNSAATYSKS